MTYTEEVLYNYIVNGTTLPKRSIRNTLGEHLNPDIIGTYESKYSQRADTTFTYLVKAYGFTSDTYRNYYTVYCKLRASGKVTTEHLSASPFFIDVTAPNLERPTTPQEVIDLRMQVATQYNQICALQEQLLQQEEISNKLALILRNQDLMQKNISQQFIVAKSNIVEDLPTNHNKYKESLEIVQKHFSLLYSSCGDVVRAFKRLKANHPDELECYSALHKELWHLLRIVEAIRTTIGESLK